MTESELTFLRWCAIVALVFVSLGAFGELVGYIGAWALVVVVPWLAVLVVTRGRTRLSWLLLLVPIGLGPALLIEDVLSNPCAIRPLAPEVVAREGVVRGVPPHPQCRIELTDGSVEYDGGYASHFIVAFGWWVLACVVAYLRRPWWPWRLAIIAVTWFVAAAALFSI